MISKATFYRASLAAPVVVPAIAAGLGFLIPALFLVPAVFVGGSLIFTWWSYPLFGVAVLLWSRGRTSSELERASRWFPIFYAPLCGLQSAILYGRPFSGEGATWWGDFFGGAVLALIFGYIYVGAVLLLGRILSDPRSAAGSPTLWL